MIILAAFWLGFSARAADFSPTAKAEIRLFEGIVKHNPQRTAVTRDKLTMVWLQRRNERDILQILNKNPSTGTVQRWGLAVPNAEKDLPGISIAADQEVPADTPWITLRRRNGEQDFAVKTINGSTLRVQSRFTRGWKELRLDPANVRHLSVKISAATGELYLPAQALGEITSFSIQGLLLRVRTSAGFSYLFDLAIDNHGLIGFTLKSGGLSRGDAYDLKAETHKFLPACEGRLVISPTL
jgi:hypothetical protein